MPEPINSDNDAAAMMDAQNMYLADMNAIELPPEPSMLENMLDAIITAILNLSYAALGGVLLIFFCWLAGHIAARSFKFKISDQLREGNIAVGLAVLGIFLGLGIGLGLVIGFSME